MTKAIDACLLDLLDQARAIVGGWLDSELPAEADTPENTYRDGRVSKILEAAERLVIARDAIIDAEASTDDESPDPADAWKVGAES